MTTPTLFALARRHFGKALLLLAALFAASLVARCDKIIQVVDGLVVRRDRPAPDQLFLLP